MWISLKLFLEVVIERKFNSWDVRTFKYIFWKVIKTTRDCPKANNAEYQHPESINSHYSFLKTLNKRLRTSSEINCNFSEIHISQGLDVLGFSLSVSWFSLDNGQIKHSQNEVNSWPVFCALQFFLIQLSVVLYRTVAPAVLSLPWSYSVQ